MHFHEGNPSLKPQETDSYEAGYQYRKSETFYLATLYYRENTEGVTEVVTTLPGDAQLTTLENLTRSRSAGLELSASGRTPLPVRLGTRRPVYIIAELESWLTAGAPDRETWQRLRGGRP